MYLRRRLLRGRARLCTIGHSVFLYFCIYALEKRTVVRQSTPLHYWAFCILYFCIYVFEKKTLARQGTPLHYWAFCISYFYIYVLEKRTVVRQSTLLHYWAFCILYFCIYIFMYLRRRLLRGRARLCTIGHSTFPPILRSSQNYFWTGIVEQDNV